MMTFAAISILGLPRGFSGIQSALDTNGAEAADIAWLITIFTLLCAAIWLLVMIALGIGLLRRERRAGTPPLADHYGPRRTQVIAGATALTALTVIALTVLSYLTDKSLATPQAPAVSITLIGHQWWWEIRYDDKEPSRSFTTANEIHVPVGVPVRVQLESTDVIHSFWVPSLAGKQDLIPGWKNAITFTAQSPGLYRGQCAEFCGLQHAHMGLLVIAQTPDEFKAWSDQRVAAAQPPKPDVKQGHDVFMTRGCFLCHGIRGTTAGGKVAPDLTHFGSQRSIAADTLPLTHDNLVTWIRDPQGVKPGSNMPRVSLTDKERDAVARYLESLK